MWFRSVGLVVALILVLTAAAAEAQPAGKVYRVGVMWTATPEALAPLVKAFEEGLRAHGYVPGGNLVLEHRFARGRLERMPEIARELVELPVDVLVAPINPVATIARTATTRIPIVMTLASDPVRAGLVTSLARPGGNITGLTFDVSPEVAAKQLGLLSDAVPTASRFAYLINPNSPAAVAFDASLEAGAQRRKLGLLRVNVAAPRDFEPAFAQMRSERVGGAVVIGDPLFFGNREHLGTVAEKHRIPLVQATREFLTGHGALLAYGPSLADLFRRGAAYVDRILKGANPADLPIEQPTVFELVIDARAARSLALTIPPSLLLRADHIIE